MSKKKDKWFRDYYCGLCTAKKVMERIGLSEGDYNGFYREFHHYIMRLKSKDAGD